MPSPFQGLVAGLKVKIILHTRLEETSENWKKKKKNLVDRPSWEQQQHVFEFKTKSFNQEELKSFTYEFKKSTNLEKLHFWPKIHKRLPDITGRPVISNCGTPTEKASEFVDFHLKPIMQNGWSY